ncbi:MAG: glycosyltransferase family 4 protein [Candidatus Omnitrophica bacterium]|nr:glycosyltransferase family 4 protein [Candidatus Omnitrophota bacterium]
MNVLFLTTHLNTGGITSYLLTLARGMRRRGVGVSIGSSGGNMENEFRSAGATVVPLAIRTKSELDIRIYACLPRLKRLVSDYKIDIIHSHTRITQVMGTWLSRVTGVPYVSTCHGFFKPRLARRLFPCWGEAVIAISGPVRDHLRADFGIPDEKISIVHSGVDVELYSPVDTQAGIKWRNKYNLGEGPALGMIARFSDVKGQDIAIEAMRTVVQRVPGAKLLLAGEGKMEQKLREMVKSFQLESRVIFCPIVNQTAGLLSALDIFLVPSRQEGLGLSIMEAQAAGLPVVASRVGGIPGLIEHGRTGILVEPENPAALAEAVIVLCRDERRRAELGKAAREFVRKNYSADAMVAATLDFYKSAI